MIKLHLLFFILLAMGAAFTSDLKIALKYIKSLGKSGNGPLEFQNPTDIIADRKGNLYIVDSGNNRIQKISSSHTYLAQFGGYGSGQNRLKEPRGCCMGRGFNIYICDTENQRIVQLDHELKYRAEFQLRDNFKEFKNFRAYDICMASNGDIYISETDEGKIIQFTRFDKIKRVFENFSAGIGGFISPVCLRLINYDIFIGDNNSGSVLKFDLFGNFLFSIGSGIRFTPSCIESFDADKIIIANQRINSLEIFNINGQAIKTIDLKKIIPDLGTCSGIAIYKDKLYVLDSHNNKIHILWLEK